jgi:hypothetical protein
MLKALILICVLGSPCTGKDNARAFFYGPKVIMPTECALLAMQQTAQVSDLIGPDEFIKVICEGR